MKFDYVIGNPPYQLSYGDSESGNKTYAPPIYHAFMDAAFEISDRTELITPARFLFDAGSTPKAWNHKSSTILISKFWTTRQMPLQSSPIQTSKEVLPSLIMMIIMILE